MQIPVQLLGTEDGSTHGSGPSMAEPLPLLAVVNAILRNRFRILALVLVLCLGVVVYALIKPREYASTASFSLQESDSRHLSGLAAQIGLAIPGNDGSQSPAYYVELLGSREILTRAAASRYSYRLGRKLVSGTLADIYGVDRPDSVSRYEETVRRLVNAISTDRSRETGIVRVSVLAPSPTLAQQLLTRLLDLLNEFNLKTRQSQAANERRFIEQRMTEIGAELRAAEDRLQNFLQRNRGGISNIPELALEHERLLREISIRQQVYTSLSQSYEQARIEEVRDTPAITVIEPPDRPVRPAPRGLIRNLIIALFLGLITGTLPLVMRVLLTARKRTMEEEVEEFHRLRREIKTWRTVRHSEQPLSAREA